MASQNRDIKMRIFLEAGNAEKAYNAFVQRVEKNQARMAELKKQGLTGSAEYKELREEAKMMQQLVKMTQQTYEDLGKAVKNVNSKAVFELEGLIKEVNKRLRTLMPGKDDAEFNKLSSYLGQLQREMASRNQQIKEQAMRSYKEVLKDIHTSQENLNAISRQGRAVAVARNDEENALKRLQNAQASYDRAVRKAQKYEQERAAKSAEIASEQTKFNNDVLFAIEKQMQAEENLLNLQNAGKKVRNDPNYANKLKDANQQVQAQQANVTSVVSAHNADAVAVAKLIGLQREYLALTSKPVKTPDPTRHASNMAVKQEDVNNARRVREEAERVLASIQSKAGNDQPFQHSIETLRRLYNELKAVQSAEMDVASRNEMNLHLMTIDKTIKEMETHLMTNAQVQETYRKAVDEITKGTGANSAALRDNIEMMKLAQKSKQIDAEMNARLSSAIQASTRLLENEGHSYMNLKQASKAYHEAKLLIAEGDKANVDQLRLYISMMEQAEHVEGLQVRQKQAFTGALKEMKDMLSSTAQNFITLQQADTIYANGINNTVGSLKDAIDLYKHLASSRDTDAAAAQSYNNKARELNDILTKQVEVSISDAQAQNMVRSAIAALKDPTTMEAAELRNLLNNMRQIQTATGPLVKTTQDAARAEKQITDVLNGRNKATMDAAMAATEYAKAESLIRLGSDASASAVKAMITAMQEAQVAEGVTIAKSNEYYLTEQKLRDMLQSKVNTVMTANEALQAYGRATQLLALGDTADAAAVKESIAQMERAKVARGISIEMSRNYAAVLERLKNALNGTTKASIQTAYDANLVEKTINNIKKAPIDDLKKSLEMVEKEMKSIVRETDEYTRMTAKYKKLKEEVDSVNKSLRNQKEEVKKVTQEFQKQDTFFGKAIGKLMNYLGIFGGFYMVREQMQKAFEANIKFDESLSNIRKTTGLTSEAVEMLADNIKRINSRTSLEDMNALAYSAGRLGIKGVSDLMGFVRAADEVKIALGEQLGDSSQAIEQLMKINTLMGVTTQYGLEEGIRRTGSALNYLTMNSQATAQPMVDFMKRTSGISKQSGITTAELTGLAGAVNALGQNVEMSATSFSKMVVQISSNSAKVAKALKLSNEETQKFIYDISSGHMMDAFLTMLRKVNEGGGLSHLGTIVKDLGSEGQRVIQTIATLAKNYETVEQMVRMSNNAFEEGTSVTDEYNLKNATTAALLDKLKNNFSKLFVSPEAVEYIRELLMDLQELPEKAKRIVMDFEPLLTMLKTLVSILTSSTAAFSGFIGAMMTRTAVVGIINWVYGLVESVGKFTQGLAKATGAANKFKFAINSAFMGNIITAGLTAIMYAFNKWREHVEKTRMAIEDTVDTLQRIKDQSRTTTAEIQNLLATLRDQWDNTEERKKLIDQINQQYGSYLSNLISEGEEYENIERILTRVNAQLQLKALLEGQKQKEKEIRDENQNDRGVARRGVRNIIADALGGEGSSRRANLSAASTITQKLLEQREDGSYYADQFMFQGVNENGVNTFKRYKYDNTNIAVQDRNSRYDAAEASFDKLVKETLKDYNETHETNLVLQGHVFDKVGAAMEKYFEQITEEEEKIQVFRDEMSVEQRRKADEIWESGFGEVVQKAWESIQDTVEQYDEKTGARPLARAFIRPDQDQYYIDRKNAMSDKDRSDEEGRVKKFLNVIDDMMEVYEGMQIRYKEGKPQTEANETGFYKLLRMRQANATEYLRVLTAGKIENKPDNGGNGKNPGNDMYADIIARIKMFFEDREAEYRQQYAKGNLTQVEMERELASNTIQLHEMLKQARLRIAGKITKDEYEAALAVMKDLIVKNGSFGTDIAYANVAAVGDPSKIGDFLRKMAKTDDEEGKKANATLSGLRKEAAADETAILEIVKKQSDALLKLLMENNPLGALDEKWQRRFEEMNLMYMKLGGNTPEERQENERIAMSKMQELGSLTGNFDITTKEGLEGFYNEIVRLFPDFAKAYAENKEAAMKQVESMYYETYQYNRDIDEAITKQVDKHKKLWEKMYKQSPAYQTALDNIENIKEQYKYLNRMQGFGFSNRTALARNVVVKQNEEDLQRQIWENNKRKAKAALDAAKADQEAGKDGAEARVKEAEAELAKIQEMPEAVRNAIQSTTDAINALLDSQHEWMSNTVKAFDTFMDGFAPFRSWYEDKGTKDNPFWRNVVGTKEERQKAFGQFMDDLKKMIREEYMAQTRAKMTKWLEEQRRKKEEAKEKMLQEAQKQAELASETDFYEQLNKTKLDLQNKFQEESLKSLEEYNKKKHDIELKQSPLEEKSMEQIEQEQALVEQDRLNGRLADNQNSVDVALQVLESNEKHGLVIEEDFQSLLQMLDEGLDDIQSGFEEWLQNSPELASLEHVDTSSYNAYRNQFNEHAAEEQISGIEDKHTDAEPKQPSEKPYRHRHSILLPVH